MKFSCAVQILVWMFGCFCYFYMPGAGGTSTQDYLNIVPNGHSFRSDTYVFQNFNSTGKDFRVTESL